MATVVNNPSSDTSGSGLGFVLGIVLLVAVLFLFFIYGLPALRGGYGGGTGTQVNLPSHVDVNTK